jgi:hypothetical protein
MKKRVALEEEEGKVETPSKEESPRNRIILIIIRRIKPID